MIRSLLTRTSFRSLLTSNIRCFATGFKPTIKEAESMSREVYEMPDDILLSLAVEGNQAARRERLIREIMAVEEVEWDIAKEKFAEIDAANAALSSNVTLPYKVLIGSSLFVGLATFPLCFELNTAIWFNHAMVTTEVPGKEDLETTLEVGQWTWNWMEPPLGQLSFFLLTLQFARSQMKKIGIKPMTDRILSKRANTLADQYPQYHRYIVRQFSKGADL